MASNITKLKFQKKLFLKLNSKLTKYLNIFILINVNQWNRLEGPALHLDQTATDQIRGNHHQSRTQVQSPDPGLAGDMHLAD